MKHLLKLFSSLISGSKTKNEKDTSELSENSTEISFQVTTDDFEIFENGIYPWISIKNTESEIDYLIGKDDIVINKNDVIIFGGSNSQG